MRMAVLFDGDVRRRVRNASGGRGLGGAVVSGG